MTAKRPQPAPKRFAKQPLPPPPPPKKKRKKAERKPRQCDCVRQVNEQLDPKGLELDDRLVMSFQEDAANGKLEAPLLSLRWKGKKRSGQSLPSLFCAYCPFCGEKRR